MWPRSASPTNASMTCPPCAPPVGRGWEYLVGDATLGLGRRGGRSPLAGREVAAPSVEAGRYDLVVDPTNLWLTIHESVGHATELDRALGYEAAYAGTSFATLDQLGTLRYGSDLMNVTGDRTTDHGLATVGYDDEGVEAQTLRPRARRHPRRLPARPADGRRARAGPLERLRVRRLRRSHPDAADAERVAAPGAGGRPSSTSWSPASSDGLYVVGDKSWSIDMQRYNFQFTGQRFYRIENGRLAGQVSDVAYQATHDRLLGRRWRPSAGRDLPARGAFNCGKGQPGQVAPVSHGGPAAVFEGVNVLNTLQEAHLHQAPGSLAERASSSCSGPTVGP